MIKFSRDQFAIIMCIFLQLCFSCRGNEQHTKSAKQIATLNHKLICIGGGITSSVGLSGDQAYPKILENLFLAGDSTFTKVVNAGIKGETIEGVNERIEWMLQQKFSAILIAMEEQDTQPLKVTAWKECIQKIRTTNPDAIILIGIISRTQTYSDVKTYFSFLSDESDVKLLDLQLKQAADTTAYWQSDKIYLTLAGQNEIARKVFEGVGTVK